MKKMYFVLFAAVLAIGLSAFTTQPNLKADDDPEYWFILQAGGTASNPLHYSMVGDGSSPPGSCNGGSNRCAIKTEVQGVSDPNPGYPFVNTFSLELKRSTP